MDSESWILDVSDAEFERKVVERSHRTPVVVDFWAPWCGPCRTLGPLLERVVGEQRGELLLARIDIDRAPQTAARLGVRSIPAVMGLRGGAIVDEFVGAQPESVVREFVSRLLPSPADRLVRQAQTQQAEGLREAAEATLRRALEADPRHAQALLALARTLAERGESEAALEQLSRISAAGPIARDAERLAADLRTRGAGDAHDLDALRARVTADPSDLDARLALGRGLAATGDPEGALTELLDVVRCDPKHADGSARLAMLDLFAVLGSEHPLTRRFRSELARALFR